MNKILSFLLLIVTLPLFAAAQVGQTEKAKPAIEDLIGENIALAPCKNSERLEAVKSLFKSAGATDADMKIDKLGSNQNLIITKKGKTAETVVIGAHYDKVKDGCGAIDNWTGIVIIANLYRSMRGLQSDKTYLFVAFDREEEGLLGSHAMVKAIAKEDLPNYCSMINLDSFGFAYPQVMDNTSSPKMAELAEKTMGDMGIPYRHAPIPGADADSSSFLQKNIPAITFHGLNAKWPEYLHSSKDVMENIKPKSVVVGFQMTLSFIAQVDAAGCNAFKKDK
jgi:Zn-dependent M28 family amino/carboxypeptidase